MDTQILITHGTTDLQILLRDETGKLWRAAPDDTIVRRFHTWLLEQHAQGLAMAIDLPEELEKRENEATISDWVGDTFGLWTPKGQPVDATPEQRDGKLCVVLPKIEPPLRKWLRQQQGEIDQARNALAAAPNKAVTRFPIQSALVLSTDRGENDKQGNKEPVATFTFVKEWLTGLGGPQDNITEAIYLRENESLEGKGLPIHPEVAKRLEAVVRNFYRPNNKLRLITTGGIPSVKDVLQEAAYLIAGKYAANLFKTELDEVGLAMATPLDALRIRRQCLFHVQRGAFLEAYAVAQPFHRAPEAQDWVEPLRQAAELLNGNPVHKSGEALALPVLGEILGYAQKAACLLVAIRVESALLTERWLEAINGSMTFLEAAFHDAINAWTKDHCKEYEPRRRRMVFRAEPSEILIENDALKPWGGKINPSNYRANVWNYQANMVGEKSLDAWSKVLENPAIDALRTAFYDSSSQGRLADYRNYNTHGVLTQKECDAAIKRFMGANLWSQGLDNPVGRPSPGKAFLDRPLVANTINSLLPTSIEPAELYRRLINQLATRLKNPSYEFAV
jgi:hypothetical protein